MPQFEKHIVCANRRPNGHPRVAVTRPEAPTCRVPSRPPQRGIRAAVRANKAGCLDQCEHGPTAVVYPEAIWYGNETLADVGGKSSSHISFATVRLNAWR